MPVPITKSQRDGFGFCLLIHLAVFNLLTVTTARAESSAAGASPAEILEIVFERIGFDADDIEELSRGAIVSKGVPELEKVDSEMAATLAVYFPQRPEVLINSISPDAILNADPKILAFQQILDDKNKDFANIAYTQREAYELRRLQNTKPGKEFNLHSSEYHLLKNADPTSAYARILNNRYTQYTKTGLEGILNYTRKREVETSPADLLTTATESLLLLQRFFPTIYYIVRYFPESNSTDVRHFFYWKKKLVQRRPNFSLSHMMLFQAQDIAIMVEREYYVGHTYDSLQFVIGFFPWRDGTLIVLLNQTFTGRVTGFASGIARAVGRNMIQDTIRGFMEKLRRQLDLPE
ncbi:MAG: hypothetical protein MJA83_15240 [Gammaproteobacteria bacterium]|nr:hypothetical protein [Gammaproteobacteria bacterium]